MSISKIVDSIDMRFKNNSIQESAAKFDRKDAEVNESNPGPEETMAVVEKLNNSVDKFNGRLSFQYHERTHQVIMKVIDPSTEEIVREIPAKDAIRLLEHIQDYLGMLVDESR